MSRNDVHVLLLCINQQTKFEVHSFTNSTDMIGAKFNKRVPDYAPFKDGSSSAS